MKIEIPQAENSDNLKNVLFVMKIIKAIEKDV